MIPAGLANALAGAAKPSALYGASMLGLIGYMVNTLLLDRPRRHKLRWRRSHESFEQLHDVWIAKRGDQELGAVARPKGSTVWVVLRAKGDPDGRLWWRPERLPAPVLPNDRVAVFAYSKRCDAKHHLVHGRAPYGSKRRR
jgi:hypothetical protein